MKKQSNRHSILNHVISAATLALCSSAALSPLIAADVVETAARPTEPAAPFNAKETHFIQGAAQGDMAELQMGELAIQKANRENVKEFGRRLMSDRSKLLQELKELATKHGIAWPTELDPKYTAALERLSRLKGEEFDKTYLADILKEHKIDIEDYETLAASGEHAQLKAYVQKALPVLKAYRDQAEALRAEVQQPEK